MKASKTRGPVRTGSLCDDPQIVDRCDRYCRTVGCAWVRKQPTATVRITSNETACWLRLIGALRTVRTAGGYQPGFMDPCHAAVDAFDRIQTEAWMTRFLRDGTVPVVDYVVLLEAAEVGRWLSHTTPDVWWHSMLSDAAGDVACRTVDRDDWEDWFAAVITPGDGTVDHRNRTGFPHLLGA